MDPESGAAVFDNVKFERSSLAEARMGGLLRNEESEPECVEGIFDVVVEVR